MQVLFLLILFIPIKLWSATNIALSKTATASGAEATHLASAAVDADTTTRWGNYQQPSAALDDSGWIYVDLTKAYYVDSVSLKWQSGSSANFKIAGSADATTWAELHDVPSATHACTDLLRTPLKLTTAGYYRYIRMKSHQVGFSGCGQTCLSLYDFNIYVKNLAKGKTVTVSGTTSGTAAQAVDEDVATRWESLQIENEWIYVDLGANYTVDSVYIDWEEQAAEEYTISYSADASSWSTAATVTGVIDYQNKPTTFTAATGRYWRILSTKRTNNDWAIKVGEFQIFGFPLDVEISVSGNSTEIVDGDASPSTTDYTDFGTIDVDGGVVMKTYTISNTGTGSLALSGTPKVAISGTHSADFTVYAQPTSPVTGSGTTTFKIEFNPTGSGTRSAAVSITNDDASENPYNFSIQGTGEDEDYSTWSNHATFVLNTTSTGANVSSNVTDFPVLVRLTSNEVDFADVLAGGADIRFSDALGTTHYAFDIDRWDDTDEEAEIWVRIPTVLGNSNSQHFRMYYNKAGQTTRSCPTCVFKESANWLGVWHLNDYSEATAKLANATTGAAPTATDQNSCQIGDCYDFDGVNDYLVTADNGYLDAGNLFSVMFWAKNEGGAPGNDRIFSRKNDYTDATGWEITMDGGAATNMEMCRDNGCENDMPVGFNWSTVGTFKHLAFKFNGTNLQLYVDGDSTYGKTMTDDISDNNLGLVLGDDNEFDEAQFDGKLDEVWLYDSLFSASFIKLAYANQKTSQTFVTLSVDAGFSDWTYSKNLAINTAASGANVANNVLNFPLLIRLTSANFTFTQAKGDGRDLRFTKSNNTELSYQIVRYDSTNQAADIYVRVDTVYGNNSSQYIKMYWGNSVATSNSSGSDVFRTSNGFVGVWHMDTTLDATNNGLTATKKTLNTEPVEGTAANCVIGKCMDFDGTNDYMTVTDNAALDIGGTFSVLFWAKNEGGAPGNDRIITRSTAWNYATGWAITLDASAATQMEVGRDGGFENDMPVGINWNTSGIFHHVAFKFNGTTMRIYMNGDSTYGETMAGSISDNNINLVFGDEADYDENKFDGKLDEVWIVDSVVSGDFIKLAYQNQKSTSSFVAAGPDNYNDWTYTKNIPINTTSTGANVSGNVVGLPIPVKLTSSNFTFSQSRNGCPDIRFAKSNGTHIPYQIERCDSTSALADIWVRPDTIYGNNSTQYIKMYWGNVQAVDSGSRTATFKTTDSYQAVYHLAEDGNTTAGGYLDATSNNYHGTGAGSFSSSSDTVSVIGMGERFDGNGDNINLPDNVVTAAQGTISLWMRTPAAITGTKYAFGSTLGDRTFVGYDNAPSFYTRLDGVADFSTTTIAVNTWYHAALTWDGAGNGTLYVNGTSVSTTTGIAMTDVQNENIGSYLDGTNNEYYGVIDEVQVSSVARDSNWVKLSYETQKPSGTSIESPDWGNATLGALNGGAIRDSAIYIGTDSDSLYKISLTDGSKKWTYNATSYGDVGMPTYVYNATSGKYEVFAAAGNYIVGRRDNGISSTQIFAPINLAATTGNPYVNDSSYLYVTYTNKIGKYNAATGVSKGGNYPVTLTGVATTVDPLVMNDNIWVATSAGVVWKYDDDGTALSSYNSNSTLSYPLHLSNNMLLIAPSSKDSLIALEVSGMGKVWAVKLAANNTGPPFSIFGSNNYYTVSGANIQKVVHGGASGSVSWTYTAAASITSSPIIMGSYVYFGAAGGRYYAITDASGALQSGWPIVTATGNANYGPWIDITYNRVLFGTDAGEVDAIDLE